LNAHTGDASVMPYPCLTSVWKRSLNAVVNLDGQEREPPAMRTRIVRIVDPLEIGMVDEPVENQRRDRAYGGDSPCGQDVLQLLEIRGFSAGTQECLRTGACESMLTLALNECTEG
jgi:hypothetical protein